MRTDNRHRSLPGRMCVWCTAYGVWAGVWMNLTQFHINQKCSQPKPSSGSHSSFAAIIYSFPRVHLGANRISIVETNCELNEVLKFQQPCQKIHRHTHTYTRQKYYVNNNIICVEFSKLFLM